MSIISFADMQKYLGKRLKETGTANLILDKPLTWYKTKEDAINAGIDLWGEGVECCVVDEEKKQYIIRRIEPDDMFEPLGSKTRYFKYVTISDEEIPRKFSEWDKRFMSYVPNETKGD